MTEKPLCEVRKGEKHKRGQELLKNGSHQSRGCVDIGRGNDHLGYFVPMTPELDRRNPQSQAFPWKAQKTRTMGRPLAKRRPRAGADTGLHNLQGKGGMSLHWLGKRSQVRTNSPSIGQKVKKRHRSSGPGDGLQVITREGETGIKRF